MSKKDNLPAADASEALLCLMRKSLFGIPHSLTEEEQTAALAESRHQSVYCLAAQSVTMHNDKIRRRFCTGQWKNTVIFDAHARLHELLRDNGIPYTVLKGAASAFYYPQPSLRTMGDVDFLIDKDNLDRVCELLEANGYVHLDIPNPNHTTFEKDDVHFELHFSVNGIPDGKAGEYLREFLTDTVDSSCESKIGLWTFQNPSPFHHGIVMLLHLQTHLRCGGIGLRHLCDWAMFINHFTNTEFTDLFEEKLKKCGMWTFAQCFSLASHIGFGVPYKEFMGNNRPLAQRLISDIFDGGNFGHKDTKRIAGWVFMQDKHESDSRIHWFVTSINNKIFRSSPIVEKYKILLPFVWVALGCRCVWREITGKRASSFVTRAFIDSNARWPLLEQLEIFETDNR